MKGRKHKNGGIDIGKDLEVENNEVMQTSPKEIKVYSAQKFLGGQSPAELVLKGNNPDKVFEAQEHYKKVHKINDDGTKKKAKWGWFKKLFGMDNNNNDNDNVENIQTPVMGEDNSNNNNSNNYKQDVASRQAYAESKYDINVKNSKNAKGLYQIRPIAVKEYNRQTGDSISYESVLNPDTAIMVRNKLMDSYMNKSWVANPKNENDTVTTFKAAMAYNMGEDNARIALNSMKENGIDIYSINGLLKGIKDTDVKSYAGFIATGNSQKDKIYLNDSIYKVYRAKNKNLDDKIRKSQKFGGMNNSTKNAIVLGYSHSTGKRKKAQFGLAQSYYDTMNLSFKKPNISYNYGDITTYGDKTNNQKQNNDKSGLFSGLYWGTQGLNSLGQMVGGIIGASADYKQNMSRIKSQEEIIDRLKAPQESLTKLKTNFNINPQLSEAENRLGQTIRDIDANTSSSQTALNRKRNARLNASLLKNQLFGQKENIETHLINQDRMQQAQTMARNVERESQYALTKANAKMQLEKEKAAAKSAKIQNITGSVLGGLGSLANAGLNYLQLGAGLAANPNSKKATFSFLDRAKFGKKIKLKKC